MLRIQKLSVSANGFDRCERAANALRDLLLGQGFRVTRNSGTRSVTLLGIKTQKNAGTAAIALLRLRNAKGGLKAFLALRESDANGLFELLKNGLERVSADESMHRYKKCPQCGRSVPSTTLFCPFCGEKLLRVT